MINHLWNSMWWLAEEGTRAGAWAGAGAWARTRARTRAGTGAGAVDFSDAESTAIVIDEPTTIDRLAATWLSGDMQALVILHDALYERGESMLPLETGKTYFIEGPRWYTIATIREVGSLHIGFSKAACCHYLADLPSTLATGKFSGQDEISPLPPGGGMPAWMVFSWLPWPHAVPSKRTHGVVA